MDRIIYDNFPDVYAFRKALQTRPDTGSAGHSARDNSEDFSGMPLDRAYMALTDGLPEVSENLKRELNRFKCVISGNISQRRPINYYNGQSPNVPAAIIGLPKSMRKVVKTPSKVKTVTLFYASCANCGTEAETLENSGKAVLQLVYWLELNGYRVRFCLIPYLASEDQKEWAICSVLLKDFQQPLDILKLSFSITSVSMFRRLGFRWLETVPGLHEYWGSGYGRTETDRTKALKMLGNAGVNTDNAYFIQINDCESTDFDPLKLADRMGIKVG